MARNAECHDTYYDSGTSVCFNSTLENVLSSPHDDTIIANGAVNVFGGYDPQKTTGHDRIQLAETDDIVDLRTFAHEEVTWSQEGSDLVLTLEESSSITIVDYYSGYAPKVRFLGSVSGRTNHLPAVYRLLLP